MSCFSAFPSFKVLYHVADLKMQIMEPDVKLHSLIDMSMSQAAIADVLDNIEDDFIWLDEILTECKNTFSL